MRHNRFGVWLVRMVLLGGMALPGTIRAQVNSWSNPQSGTWNWGTATNWLLLAAPTINQSAIFITNAVSGPIAGHFRTINIDSTTPASTLTISNLTLSAPGVGFSTGSHSTVELANNAGSTAPLHIIRTLTISSGGNLAITNSTLQVDGVGGGFFSDDGDLLLNTGTIITTNAFAYIGNAGSGEVTILDGTWLGYDGIVGNAPGSQGTLTVAGGTNIFSSFLDVGLSTGASGAVWLTGGDLTITNGVTLVGSSGIGQMTVSNGTWRANGVTVGANAGSQGTLAVAGGNTVSTSLDIGAGANAAGNVWLTGGQLIVTNIATSTVVGDSGVGQMTVSNGTWLAYSVFVGYIGGQGTLTIAGGTNTVKSTFDIARSGATGAVWLQGGLLTATNDVTYVGSFGVGQLTVSNGTWLSRNIAVTFSAGSRGTLTVAGGTLAANGPLTIGTLNATGTVWITGGQLVITNTPATVGAGSGLVIDGSATLTNGSSINVSNVNTVVGNVGSGSLTVLGGSFLANSLVIIGNHGIGNVTQSGGQMQSDGEILGFNPGAQGTLSVAGGVHIAAGGLTLASGSFAAGVVWVTGGQLAVTNISITLLVGDAGVGLLTVSNGTVLSRNADVGVLPGSLGTLTTAGGTNTVLSNLTIGDNATATGVVWVMDGRLAVSNSVDVGRFGIGQMTVSNGTAYSSTVLVAAEAGSQGTLTAAGGTDSINSSLLVGTSDCTATGSVIVAGGNLFVTNAAHNAVLEVRSGTVQVNSGSLVVDQLIITNGCGRFIHTGGTLIYGSLVIDPNFSAVGDGIPNGWKQQYGFDPFDPTVASADPDGDGCNNLCEFLAGSNPVADIKSITKQGNDIRVTWQAAASKTNALQSSPGSNGSYSNNFTDIFIVTTNIGSVTNYLDVGGATNTPSRYYRVRLVP